ncbi:MAG: GTPase RsgA [Candidatus Diapherotrites archaeon]|jgi:ribosome biogenesis GTPase A|uniref:GTPase RsgA n=1 Tax=Candidatus Iainarchaeum sp. TaxID=3101447 RepID=A0A7K4BYS2_9ARCH|nr:GTPase RsgA [Candidatus Diapherotrites archaeon]
MVSGFFKHIYFLIKESDLVLEILDARHPEKTRNYELEQKIIHQGKKLLLIINKSDLVEKKEIEKIKQKIQKETKMKVIFVSAKNKDGINMIRREINAAKGKKEKYTVGIIGYPNVGKSTLINSLAGKGKGRVATSRKAGLTRGMSKVKITEGVYLIDSPGIIPRENQDEFDLFLVDSKNPNQLKDLEKNALKLITHTGIEKICKIFEIKYKKEMGEEETLEEIGKKKHLLKSGGEADTKKAARFLLEKYQKHELK